MTIETVFYTQVGSILAFLGSLFVLYRLLVSSKDATIETLKEQINFLKTKIETLTEQSPDVLLRRIKERATLLEEELKASEKEKEPLTAEIEDLKKKIAAPESPGQQQALVNQLVAVTQHVAFLNAERHNLTQRLREVEEPYFQFFQYANGELSPGRRRIVGDIVSHLGVEWVITARPEEIMQAFARLAAETRASGMHPHIHINGGALTGLRSVGLITDRDVLTLVGVSMFKAIAKELKSNKAFKADVADATRP